MAGSLRLMVKFQCSKLINFRTFCVLRTCEGLRLCTLIQ